MLRPPLSLPAIAVTHPCFALLATMDGAKNPLLSERAGSRDNIILPGQ